LKKILLVCSLLLFFSTNALAKYDPAFIWTTLETPHFFIHFHQGEQETALRTAVLAEDIHARLAPRIKWTPKDKTHFVLVDAEDEANGSSNPFPYNHVVLYLTPPIGQHGLGTTTYDDWLRMLITHEYTHVLQGDMVTGGLGWAFQTLFGRYYFPNELQPIWLIEGLAVYEETELTQGGRGRSPGSDMILRMAVLDERFPTLGSMAAFPDTWPAGEVPYLFGGAFNRYIAEKYGRDKLADIGLVYSGRGFPFLVESTANRVLKKEYSDLWDEWRNELTLRYTRVRDEVRAKGLSVSLDLTSRGYQNSDPAFSPDGARIAYVVENADEFPGIYLMNADGTNDHKLVENTFSSGASGRSIAWSPDGTRIYYSKIEVFRNTDYYNDLYYYDLTTNKEVRITEGLRARDPFPSPDGTTLLFVTNRAGRSRIATLALSSDRSGTAREIDVRYLTGDGPNQYESPRFSPDGSRISVGVWQPGGFKDIWILDGDGKTVEEVTHDRAIEGSPVWSPDSRVLYFSSDRTGIFNLFAYELQTRKVQQITNVLGGAFTPAVSPDGKALVFSSYSSRGFDLQMRPTEPVSWKLAEPYIDTYPTITYDAKPVETSTRPYNPLPTLYPRYWLPWFSTDTVDGFLGGIMTSGQDVVQHHAYAFTGLYGPKYHRKEYAFAYAYNGFYPKLYVQAADLNTTYTDLFTDPIGTASYTERNKIAGISITIPLLKNQIQQSLTLGYTRKTMSALSPLEPWAGYTGPVPVEGVLASGNVSYQLNTAQQYDLSISPEGGRMIELGYEGFDKSLGSDYRLSRYTLDWHEYVDLPWKHHVIQVRGFAGTSSGEQIPQRAFQLGGDSLVDNVQDITLGVADQEVYLRGYPANVFRGKKAALAGAEYRFPITNLEFGLGSKPFFLRKLHGAVFAEGGAAWDAGFHSSDFKRSVGAELRLDTYVAYYYALTLRLVLSHGLDEKGETSAYLGLWAPSLF